MDRRGGSPSDHRLSRQAYQRAVQRYPAACTGCCQCAVQPTLQEALPSSMLGTPGLLTGRGLIPAATLEGWDVGCLTARASREGIKPSAMAWAGLRACLCLGAMGKVHHPICQPRRQQTLFSL